MPVNLGEVIVRFGAETAGFNSGVAGMMTRLDGLGAKMAAVGIASGVLLAVGLATAGAAAVKLGADFQQGVTRLVTGAGDVTDNMQKMGQGILNVSTATGVLTTGTDGLNAAMYQIISSGQRGAQALDTLSVSAQAAQVEQANVVDVAKAVSTAMTDYGTHVYNAAQYTNGFIAAVAHGKLTLEELSTAMSPIMPITQELGVSFADTAAAMATMTAAGLPATVAATGLRFLLQSLIAPTVKANDAFNKWGVDTTRLAETMKTSLPDALQMIYNAALKAGPAMSKPFNDAVDSMIGGQRSLRAFLDLTGTHLDTYRQNVETVLNAMKNGRDVVQGWALAQGNFNVQMERAHAVVEVFAISLGSRLLPALTPIVKGFADAMPQVQAFFDQLNQPVPGLGQWAVSLHEILTNIGQMSSNVGTLVAQSHAWDNIGTSAQNAASAILDAGSALTGFEKQSGDVNIIASLFSTLGDDVRNSLGAFQDIGDQIGMVFNLVTGHILTTGQALQYLGKSSGDVLTVADAAELLSRNITHVTDSVTGADINLKDFVHTGNLAASTTVDMASALHLVGKGAGDILTAADATKLLKLGIGQVKDATTGAVESLSDMSKSVGLFMDYNTRVTQAWYRALEAGQTISFDQFKANFDKGVSASILGGAKDADAMRNKLQAINDNPVQPKVNTANLDLAGQKTDLTAAKLKNLNEPHNIPVDTGHIVAATNATQETIKRLQNLNGPHDIPVNTSNIAKATNATQETIKKLQELNGNHDISVNTGNIAKATNAVQETINKLQELNGPHDVPVNTGNIAKATNAVQETINKLQELNGQDADPNVNTGNVENATSAVQRAIARLMALNAYTATPGVNTGPIDNATAHANTTHAALLALNGSSTWNANLVGGVYNAGGVRSSLLALNGSSTWYANLVNTTTNISRTVMMARGGVITEHIVGVGLSTGTRYELGESGNELVIPMGGAAQNGGLAVPPTASKNTGSTSSSGGSRLTHILERLEILLSTEPRVSEFQIVQALGRLLSNGVR